MSYKGQTRLPKTHTCRKHKLVEKHILVELDKHILVDLSTICCSTDVAFQYKCFFIDKTFQIDSTQSLVPLKRKGMLHHTIKDYVEIKKKHILWISIRIASRLSITYDFKEKS